MTMSRKDYESMADLLVDCHVAAHTHDWNRSEALLYTEARIAGWFAQDNIRFSPDRFRRAIGDRVRARMAEHHDLDELDDILARANADIEGEAPK